METIRLLLDLSVKYPLIGTFCIGAMFAIGLFLILLFILSQMDNKIKGFRTEFIEVLTLRLSYIEKENQEVHKLGIEFREREESCLKIQAALPIIEELTGKVEAENKKILELVDQKLTGYMEKFITTEENYKKTMADIAAGLK